MTDSSFDVAFESNAQRNTEGAPFISTYRAFLLDDKLKMEEKFTFMAIKMRCCGFEKTWISQKKLANDLGISDRTIRRHLSKLEEHGFLIRKKRPGKSDIILIRHEGDIYTFDEMHKTYTDTPEKNFHTTHTPDTGVRTTPDIDVRTTPDTGVHLSNKNISNKKQSNKKQESAKPDTPQRHISDSSKMPENREDEKENPAFDSESIPARSNTENSTRLENIELDSFLQESGIVSGSVPQKGYSTSQAVDIETDETATGVMNEFYKFACEKFAEFRPPKKPTQRELGNAKKMLSEYDRADISDLLEMACGDWYAIKEKWRHLVRSSVPNFITIFTLRRDLMPLAQTKVGVVTDSHRYSVMSEKTTHQEVMEWWNRD